MGSINAVHRRGGSWDVLSDLSEGCVAALKQVAKHHDVAAGKVLWTQGSSADYVAIIVTGKMMSLYNAHNGRSGTIGFWGRGDIIGLGDIGEREKRQNSAHCLEACSVLALSFEQLDRFISEFPEFSAALVRALSVRLNWVSRLALALAAGSAMERICTVLLALAERYGENQNEGIKLNISLTQEQLAVIAGVTRQFAHSTLKILREKRVLTGGRQLIITDISTVKLLAFS